MGSSSATTPESWAGNLCSHWGPATLRPPVVTTEEFRLPAIKMLNNSGFVPLITVTAQDERKRWQRAFDALGEPEWKASERPDSRDGFAEMAPRLMSKIREDYARIAGDKLQNSAIF